jgi:hypothetical protein
MEPEDSLPCSQDPDIDPCPKPYESSRIILPSMPGSPKSSMFGSFQVHLCLGILSHLCLGLFKSICVWVSRQVFQQHFVCISHIPHACYMPRPSHPHWFDHPRNIWSKNTHYEVFHDYNFLHTPISSSLGLYILLSTLSVYFSVCWKINFFYCIWLI